MQNLTDLLINFPLIPEAELIMASPNKPGIQGYGEGFAYGLNMNKNRRFHYRFAGKKIPRNGFSYVTYESNFFSSVVGEKWQLVLLYDPLAKGFRVIHEFTPMFIGFRAFYKELCAGNAVEIISKMVDEKTKEEEIINKFKEKLAKGEVSF